MPHVVFTATILTKGISVFWRNSRFHCRRTLQPKKIFDSGKAVGIDEMSIQTLRNCARVSPQLVLVEIEISLTKSFFHISPKTLQKHPNKVAYQNHGQINIGGALSFHL